MSDDSPESRDIVTDTFYGGYISGRPSSTIPPWKIGAAGAKSAEEDWARNSSSPSSSSADNSNYAMDGGPRTAAGQIGFLFALLATAALALFGCVGVPFLIVWWFSTHCTHGCN